MALVQHEAVNKLHTKNNMKILNSSACLPRAYVVSETADEESYKS